MATITLSYNAKNAIAKKTIKYILSLGVFKKVEKNALDISLEEVKQGKVTSYTNVEDFFEKVIK